MTHLASSHTHLSERCWCVLPAAVPQASSSTSAFHQEQQQQQQRAQYRSQLKTSKTVKATRAVCISRAAQSQLACCSRSGLYGSEASAGGMDPSSALTPPPVPASEFSSIPEALEDIRQGRAVVVVDDENRENEGDLIYAGDRMSTEQMAFMVEHTSGVICLAMEGGDLDRLQLPLMVPSEANEEAMVTAFTITADYRHDTTTGISAWDRALTVRQLSNPRCSPGDFKRPGHIFPLRYHPGGVLVRPGHTEAGVDLARLAGCFPSGCLSEVVDKRDGSMARLPQLLEFAKQHRLRCITIAQLIRHRLQHEEVVREVSRLPISLPLQDQPEPFTLHVFRCLVSGQEHLAISHGNLAGARRVALQLQPGNVFADLVDNLKQGRSSRLQVDLGQLATEAAGVVIYPAGTSGTLRGGAEQLAGGAPAAAAPAADSIQAAREAGIAAAILRKLGVSSVRLGGPGAAPFQARLLQLGVAVDAVASQRQQLEQVPLLSILGDDVPSPISRLSAAAQHGRAH